MAKKVWKHVCDCGSFAVNRDPDHQECDVCVWRSLYLAVRVLLPDNDRRCKEMDEKAKKIDARYSR